MEEQLTVSEKQYGYSMVVASCYLPLFYLVTFYSFALRAYIALGRMPAFDNPHPAELGFDIHHKMVWLSFFLTLFSPVILLLMLLFAMPRNKPLYFTNRHLIIYAAGFVICFLLARYDDLFSWFVAMD